MTAFLDNERVAFLLRRLSERALVDFRSFLSTTVREHGSNWQAHWEMTLPVIQTWSSSNMEKVAAEFTKDVPGATDLIEFVYLRYVTLAYGKDACGRKNKLQVEMITFNQLYLAFLTRLARSPEVIRGSWFTNAADRDVACERALKDAMHDVAEVRVQILPQTASTDVSHPAPSSRRASTVVSVPRRSSTSVASAASSSRTRSMVSKAAASSVASNVKPRREQSVILPDDSASQVNSLGARHQKTQQSARREVKIPVSIAEDEDEDATKHDAASMVKLPAPPRLISFKAKDKDTKSRHSRASAAAGVPSKRRSSSSSSSSSSSASSSRRAPSGSTKLTLS